MTSIEGENVRPATSDTSPDLTPEPAGVFAERCVQVLNHACLALLMSVGHQTRLFDVLATLPPATSEEIAQTARLQERYVREWLGGMVVGGVVRYDPDAKSYFLPPEHAGVLTRAAGADNFAAFMQYISLLGEVEQQVVAAFRDGGGVPYSAYPRFQQLQAEESRQMYGANLVGGIIPMDAQLEQRLRDGIEVADLGTGSGYATIVMAQAFPNSRFTGFDFSPEGIAAAQREVSELGLTNVNFEVKDIASLDAARRYDLVTAFDVIHDLAKPREVLRRVAEALEDDGIFLMVDMAASSALEENISHPLAPTLFTFSTMHCMTVSLEQGGEGLGTVWGEEKALELLREAGFQRIDMRRLEGDILHSFYFARKTG